MDFSDLETEQKLAWVQQRLGYWSSLMGGQIVTKSEDDQIELRTKIGERPTRVVVEYDMGWTEIQTKITNTTGVLVLNWDADKQPTDAAHDPEWDGGDEQVMFLAPGLYIEEYPDEAKAMWELLGRLPQPMVQEIIQAMPTRISYLKVDADKIELKFQPNFHELPDPSQLQWVFQMLDRIARHFESGQESVANKPKVYIAGQAANIVNAVSCPHCNTVVDLTQGSFCFNCGAALKPKLA
ncbi:MAG: zinc ribbon domain-containing protein [Myxococcales bacterium]|nr:zinc ribbon domain-containing protein [Myxococcales bacterium]